MRAAARGAGAPATRWLLVGIIPVVLGLGLGLGPGLVQPSAPPSSSAAVAHPCATATSRCRGEISVPIDWSRPESERLTITFLWIPRSDTTRPAAGTVLANPGGPLAAIPMTPILEEVLGPVLERRDLLVVDPRGLGESSPLTCPDLDLYDDRTIGRCAESLGPRVQYFTTDQIVADMDAVRAAVGAERISFYGNSYGTVFAQAYTARFPDRVEAVLLDSMVPVGADGYVIEQIRQDAADLELVCARSPACAALPEGPAATLERVLDTLRARPDPAVPIAALPPLRQGANVVAAREGMAAMTAYLAGDPAPLRRLTRRRGGDPVFELRDPEAAGMLAIRCGDARFPYDRLATPEVRDRTLREFYARRRPVTPFQVYEIPGFRPPAAECVHWPTPRPGPPVPSDAPRPSMPVLALAGDFDSVSPDEVTELIASFPAGQVVRVRFGTHALAFPGPSTYGPCARDRARRFLMEPPAAVRAGLAGCDGETFRALGRFPRTLAQVEEATGDGLAGAALRVVAAAYHTAADAVARRNPNDAMPRPAREPGLRGGDVRWDRETRTITLEGVRFVEDLAVTGTVRLEGGGAVTAELSATGADGTGHDLTIRWRAFVAESATEVRGRLDGVRFAARVPGH